MNEQDEQGYIGLAPHVIVIEVSHERMKNNNYVVVDRNTRQAVVVDPAFEPDKIDQALKAAQVELAGVLVTHSHDDHIDLAGTVAGAYDCPIWMSQIEIDDSGFDHPLLIPIDEEPWWVGQMQITPLLTPGHTPGCICFKIGENLFTGDVLFAEGCGICLDIPSAYTMFDTLEKLKQILDPNTKIYPGHTYVRAPGQTFATVLRRNMYLQFPDKDSFAAYRLRGGHATAKILDFQ